MHFRKCIFQQTKTTPKGPNYRPNSQFSPFYNNKLICQFSLHVSSKRNFTQPSFQLRQNSQLTKHSSEILHVFYKRFLTVYSNRKTRSLFIRMQTSISSSQIVYGLFIRTHISLVHFQLSTKQPIRFHASIFFSHSLF